MTVIDSSGVFISEKVFTGLFSSTCSLRTQESREGDGEGGNDIAIDQKGGGHEHGLTRINLFFF